jgi:large subunit ribosomal protein L9
MEVILREHVDNLGAAARSSGRRLRAQFPPAAQAGAAGHRGQQEADRAASALKFEAKGAEEQKVAEAQRDRLANVEVVIARRVGETEALYGSVTAADIAEALAAKGIEIDRRTLQLPDPIKKIGDVDVPVKLHRDVTAQLKVRVVPEGTA